MNKEIINLLQKEEFKQWVLEPNEESNLYWMKWLENNPDQRHNAYTAREIILRMRFKKRNLNEEEIDHLQIRIMDSKGKSMSHQVHHYNWTWLKIAAVVSLILSFAFLFYQIRQPDSFILESESEPEYIMKENRNGIKSRFQLPDGSKVTLNAESSIRFLKQFSEGMRIVELTGEAFFEVKKDSVPFEVWAGDHRIRVVGTKFNVNVYPESDFINVALVEGKVLVQKDEQHSQQYMLRPGEKFQYIKHSNIGKVVPFKEILETGWKDGILAFENDNFESFISKLEKWYGVEFIVNGSPQKKWNVNGVFRNESLQEILDGVSYTHFIDYTIKGKTIIINLN
jgi:transmembrane sensor